MRKTLLTTLIAALTAVSTAFEATAAAEPADTSSVAASRESIVARINASGHVSVEQPEALGARLAAPARESAREVSAEPADHASESHHASAAIGTRAGYRVQVFDDNNPRTARREAQEKRAMFGRRFPHYRAYVAFNSPYWRVKVGDFRSRSEAEAAMAEIREAFPSLAAYIRIVRDKIHIYE